MNAASVIVLATVLALAGLAAWRVFRKGAPCECGGCATPGCCPKCSAASDMRQATCGCHHCQNKAHSNQ